MFSNIDGDLMNKTLIWVKSRFSFVAVIVVLFTTVSAGTMAYAADWFVSPHLTVIEEYSSNVLFSKTVKLNDFITNVIPHLTGAYRTERFSITGDAGIGVEKFINNDNLDTINQRYNLGASYALLERLSFSANGYFRRDTTLETELVEEGLVANRQDRKRFGGDFGFQYTYSERLSFSGGYSRSYVEFPGSNSSLVDYRGNYFYLTPQYVLSPKIVLQMDMAYSRTKYDSLPGQTFDITDRVISNYRIMPSVQYSVSETLSLTGGVGYRYTQSEFKLSPSGTGSGKKTTENNDGLIFVFLLDKNWEKTSVELGARREQYSGLDGTSYTNDRFSVDARHQFSERFTGSALVWYQTNTADNSDVRDTQYFSMVPTLSYRLTRNIYLRGSVEYSKYFPEGEDDVDRFKSLLTLDMGWPRVLSGS
jgi:hypothetical protein